MDDFKEMGLLYEAFTKNTHTGHARETIRSYPANQPDNPNHTYGLRTPFNGTKGGGAFDSGQGGQGITAIVSDEETNTATFMKNDIIKKVDSLMIDAESFEDTKTMIALNELKQFIERLKLCTITEK